MIYAFLAVNTKWGWRPDTLIVYMKLGDNKPDENDPEERLHTFENLSEATEKYGDMWLEWCSKVEK